jgi:hypothetical protein
MDKQTKCLILIIAGLLLLYFVNKHHSDTKSSANSESETQNNENFNVLNGMDSSMSMDDSIDSYVSDEEANDSQNMSSSEEDTASISSDDTSDYQQKMLSKNSSPTKKQVSFVADKRGNNPDSSALDAFFTSNNPYNDPNDFFPNNDKGSGGWQAVPPTSGKNKKETTKDMFNINNYMPDEQPKNWFDSMPETVSVKNRHLINITKAVGNNTVGSSLKNPSYDIRGNEACPKFVVSPWMQSSIEPDININSWCGS